jgi:UDP-N-acetylmuramate--alanine ligase
VKLLGAGSSYRLKVAGEPVAEIQLRVPGRVAVLNSLAAAAVAREAGLGLPEIAAGLESFSGVERRFQVKADASGILVVDDYGHHPTEIRATLETAKEAFGRRTVVVFQPHRYSRVHDLFEEFCRAFHQADVLLVTEIYAAGEDPVGEVSGRKLAEGIERHGHRRVRYVPDLEEAFSALKDEMVEGDLVMTLGAGSVTGLSDRLAEEVRERAR